MMRERNKRGKKEREGRVVLVGMHFKYLKDKIERKKKKNRLN